MLSAISIKEKVKESLEKYPALYCRLLRRIYRDSPHGRRILNPETKLVVEGFPRSSSSFAMRALEYSQGVDYPIATHTHSSAQIIRAVQLNIPCVVILREPIGSVVGMYSWARELAYDEGREDRVALTKMPIEFFLNKYITFHKRLLPYTHGFVLATFEEVTGNFGNVIKKINEKYSLDLTMFDHTDDAVEVIRKMSDIHVLPSDRRKMYKEEGIKEYYRDIPEKVRKDANSLYCALIKKYHEESGDAEVLMALRINKYCV